MGPTSSGKTTISELLLKRLRESGVQTTHYDGDEFRDLFGDGYGFSSDNRNRVVQALVRFSNKALESGVNVIVSALTANPDARVYVKENVCNLLLVSIKCSISECANRDPKGLYEKAKKGEIDTLIGYNTEYLPPENPHIVIDTELNGVEYCVNQLLDNLSKFTNDKVNNRAN